MFDMGSAQQHTHTHTQKRKELPWREGIFHMSFYAVFIGLNNQPPAHLLPDD